MKKRKPVPVKAVKSESSQSSHKIRCDWCNMISLEIRWTALDGKAPKPYCDRQDGNSCVDMQRMQIERDAYEAARLYKAVEIECEV